MNRERWLEANLSCKFSQQASADGMKCTRPRQLLGPSPQNGCRDGLHAPRHLNGSPPGKREKQNSVWINAIDNEVGNPMSKGFGFAGPCSGNNQEWTAGESSVFDGAACDGLPLLFIEIG